MLDTMRRLRCVPDRQEVFLGLVLGQHAPRSSGAGTMRCTSTAGAHMVRLRQSPFQVPGTLAQAHGDVRPQGRMDDGCIFPRRRIGIEDWHQRLVVHRNQPYSIPGNVRIMGHHHCDRLL